MLKIISRVAVITVLAALSAAAHAVAVNQMFVFGDSLSDSGNAAALTPVAPGVSFFPPSDPNLVSNVPIPLPYDYVFSNGPTAPEQLASLLGTAPSLPAWPRSPDNSNPNFAVGGAMTGAGPTVATLPPGTQGLCCNYNFLVNSPTGLQPGTNPNVPSGFPAVQFTGINNQIDLFALRLSSGAIPAFNPSTTLFSVWGGANDIFLALALAQELGSDPMVNLSPADQAALIQAYTVNAAKNIGLDIAALAGLGAENFLVPNMPDLGQTPFGLSEGGEGSPFSMELTGISMGFNAVLDATITQLQAGGLDIIEFDTFDALHELIDSGIFADTEHPCLDTTNSSTVEATLPNVIGGCQGYLFFDSVHPTVSTAAILAAEMQVAVPEPNELALLAVALLASGWFGLARRRLESCARSATFIPCCGRPFHAACRRTGNQESLRTQPWEYP